MKNIVIIGMPGCGKSTFGEALAKRLGWEFIDADIYLEAKEGRTIPELFAVSEDCFRDAETRTILDLSEKQDCVIAAGGGVIKRPVNIDILKRTSVIIFLDRSPDDIISDVNISTRPLLADGKQKVYDLYNERIAVYRAAADFCLENKGSAEQVLGDLEKLAQEKIKTLH